MNSRAIWGISFAAVFAVSMIFAMAIQEAEAINTNPKNKNAGGKHSPDFRIASFGMISGDPAITVARTAGATAPTEAGDIYAYVFFTDVGAFAVVSHDFLDEFSGEQPGPAPDPTWHGHQIFANAAGCLTAVTDLGTAAGIGTSTVSITGTGASAIVVGPFGFSAGTMVLSVNDEGVACIKHIFDVA